MSFSTSVIENWASLSAALVSTYVIYFFIKFAKHRRSYEGLPTPPHSFLWGNLKVLGESMKKFPRDMHPQPMFTQMGRDYNLPGIFYVDIYPFGRPLLFCSDPAVAIQAQTLPNFNRHPFANKYLGGIVGTKSIFSTSGAEWQRQRTWFAPAFSMAHLLTLVPGMVEEVLVFKEKLTRFAVSGETFVTNDETMKLAIDLIGRNVGDIRLKSQTEYSPIVEAFSGAIRWTTGQLEPLWKKMIGTYIRDYYTRKLDVMLMDVIKEKYREGGKEDSTDKSIMDLALRGYSKDVKKIEGGKMARADLDEDFMSMALDNVKTFFTGGHDTTASLLTYMFYYLSINPTSLSRIRAEHNEVFGSSLESTTSNISHSPALLNKLPFTSAVLKECLRLHPVGFTIKAGTPGSTLSYNGREYPTDGQMICILSASMHRDPLYWANPNEFDPTRFLNPDTHSTAAWQPFEKGPRNCIGQQLALLEVRVVAVLTLRWFDFEARFKEHGMSIEGWGGRAYQELKLSAKPKDGIPMRVILRE